MYGLQNILTEQGFSIEQQCAMLELIQAAQFLEIDRLTFDLSDVGFNKREIETIMLSALTARCAPDNILNPAFLLSSLASENESHKEKSKRWLTRVIKNLLEEWQHKVIPAITTAILQKFLPQPAQPAGKEYDAIIVVDSPAQSITDGFNYVKDLLLCRGVSTTKIIIPSQTNSLNKSICVNPTTYATYIRQHLQLSSATTQIVVDEALSRQQFRAYLDAYIQRESTTSAYLQQAQTMKSGIAFYAAALNTRRNQQILLVTTEDCYAQDLQITSELAAAGINIEVIHTLRMRNFTSADLYSLLAERFSCHITPGEPLNDTDARANTTAAAAAAASAGTTYTTTQSGATHTSERASTLPRLHSSALPRQNTQEAGSTTRGYFAVGLFGLGLVAVANPETTAAVTTTVTEAAKQLAQAAVKAMFS